MVDRERARKTITLPSGQTCAIPVITRVSFLNQNGQETQHYPDNTSTGNREVHTDQVKSSASPSATIDVERIDVWKVLDIQQQAQDSEFAFDNKTGGDFLPPSFTAHQKTHVVRYYQDPNNPDDNGTWIDSELIDEFHTLDQNGQERQWFLENPAKGDSAAQADSGDPDITGSDGIDPPYRTDPYQNIVDFHDGGAPGGHEIIGVVFGMGLVSGGNYNLTEGDFSGADPTDPNGHCTSIRMAIWNTSLGRWDWEGTGAHIGFTSGTLSGAPANSALGSPLSAFEAGMQFQQDNTDRTFAYDDTLAGSFIEGAGGTAGIILAFRL
jgi:hypothetical protein